MSLGTVFKNWDDNPSKLLVCCWVFSVFSKGISELKFAIFPALAVASVSWVLTSAPEFRTPRPASHRVRQLGRFEKNPRFDSVMAQRYDMRTARFGVFYACRCSFFCCFPFRGYPAVRYFSLLIPLLANAQTATLTSAPDDGRPVDTIVRQIEQLSGIPISYEDLLYGNPSDTMDIGNSVSKVPGTHVIVPRGGALSVPVVVDRVTQKLVDSLATSTALNALLGAASSSPIVAGKFKLDSYNNVYFVVPTQSHSANNDMVPITAVLSTPIELSGTTQTAYDTLRLILNQVSQKTGVTIKIGTIPIKPFAITETSLAATMQPASYVLARLFDAVSTSGGAPPGHQGMSYHAFFDPVVKYYALNIHIVKNPNAPPLPSPTTPTGMPGAGSPLGKKLN